VSVILKGGSTSDLADVTTNKELQVALTATRANAGFAAIASEVSTATDPGGRVLRSPEAGADYRLRVGVDRALFNLDFAGTVIAQAHIQQNLSTMTAAQSGGLLTLNNGASTTATNAANVRTYATFPLVGNYPTYASFWASVINETVANATIEFGLGFVSGVAAPTDGVFFRYDSSGVLRGIANFNGVEDQTAVLTSPTTAVVHLWTISWMNEQVEFWIDNVLMAVLATPSARPMPTQARALPAFARVYNNGTPAIAKKISLGFLNVELGDHDTGFDAGHVFSLQGAGSYQVQPGTASGQTATFAVGAAPAAGTWTASTAPATNSLGGLWTSPATMPAGAETDYPMFAYLNPAGTAALPGKTLVVTGVKVHESIVTTVIGATPAQLLWGLGVGSTASSLATTDGAATVGPRRVVIGIQSFAATAAVGTVCTQTPFLDLTSAPMIVPAGTYCHITMRLLSNTAASGALRGAVTIYGYFV
jgi:hypothetical protein